MTGIRCLAARRRTVANYAYFPVLVDAGYPLTRDELYEQLRDNGIYGRRYFYPLISDFPMYRGLPSAAAANLPVAHAAAQQVLCLPIYPALTDDDVRRSVALIEAAARRRDTASALFAA